MKQFLMFIFCYIMASNVYSQTIIEMQNINGVFHIPCKVNEVPMKFVFDTGASNVSISSTEAKFLIKQGLISKDDFIETVNYQIANGEIIEGTKIFLRKIEIGDFILENIEATIIHQQNAPLLLGQSAISKLGTYTISNNKLIFGDFVNNIENRVLDSVPQARRYHIPKLSKINHFLKDEVGFKTYILKENNVNEAWVKIVSPTQQKKNSKGKTYSVKGYSRLEYYEVDCENMKLTCSAIFYFDNKDFLEYACTDILSDFSDLSDKYIYEEYKEIYNFICN
uniref:retropepsin-like aspartic protease family protein n=1 Tax=Flavobacterium sp. TaxID=239 RepID=UPI00404B1F02